MLKLFKQCKCLVFCGIKNYEVRLKKCHFWPTRYIATLEPLCSAWTAPYRNWYYTVGDIFVGYNNVS